MQENKPLSAADYVSNTLGVMGIGATVAGNYRALQSSFFSTTMASVPLVGNVTNSMSLMPLVYDEASSGIALRDLRIFPNLSGSDGKIVNLADNMKSAQEANNHIMNSTQRLGKAGHTPLNVGKIGLGLGAVMGLYSAYGYYQEEGVYGLFKGMSTYAIGTHFGLENSYQVKELGAYNKGQQALLLRQGGFTSTQTTAMLKEETALKYKVSNPNSFFRIGSLGQVKAIPFVDRMLGVMAPMVGASVGASIGYSLGESLGQGVSAMLGAENSTMMGVAGGIFGAIGGAALGGAAFSSIGSAAVTAGLFGAATIIGSVSSQMFSETMRRVSQTRPRLDFANDVQPYFSRNAVTMRQRALQAMNNSHINARSALGNEAAILHSNRDYFSNLGRL